MTYRDNICTGTGSGEAEKEYDVRVPDEENLILLMELASARGVPAYVPRGSRKRVVLWASESRARELMKECSAISTVLEVRRLKVLREVLKEHGVEFPEELDSALARLEIRTAMADN